MSATTDSQLTELYAEHAGRLFAYARRHGDAATAEDLVADAFVVALRRPGEIPDDPGEARAWLIGVVRKLAANRRRRDDTRAEHWRAAVRDLWHAPGDASAEEVVAERDECLRALAALTESDREVLLLVAWEGLSPGQAAAVLSLTPNAVTVRLHRARKRLDLHLSAVPTTAVSPAVPRSL